MLSTTSPTSQTMLLQELSVWLDEFGIFVCDHGGKSLISYVSWSGNLILINPTLRIEEWAEIWIQETNMSPDNSELTWHYFSSRIFASTI